jgi:hypothetical protein
MQFTSNVHCLSSLRSFAGSAHCLKSKVEYVPCFCCASLVGITGRAHVPALVVHAVGKKSHWLVATDVVVACLPWFLS